MTPDGERENRQERAKIHQLQAVLPDAAALDRTTINAGEDEQFLRAVKASGRKHLIMTAVWTEACLAFPTLDPCVRAMRSSTGSWMPSAAHRWKPIVLHWSA